MNRVRPAARASGVEVGPGNRARAGRVEEPAAPAPAEPRRPGPAFLALAGGVVVAAIALRIAFVGRQSYWIDELFSVDSSRGSLSDVAAATAGEVHPPLYSVALWAWMQLGGTQEVWTRLLSTLAAVLAVVVAHRGLRGLGLDEHVRWALTVATAAGGFSIAYSLETRSYALELLAAVGLTVTTLRAAGQIRGAGAATRGTLAVWGVWSLLAATTHLLGAVLSVAAATVLALVAIARRPRSWPRAAVTWFALAAAGCSLQAAWLVAGQLRPGFARGHHVDPGSRHAGRPRPRHDRLQLGRPHSPRRRLRVDLPRRSPRRRRRLRGRRGHRPPVRPPPGRDARRPRRPRRPRRRAGSGRRRRAPPPSCCRSRRSRRPRSSRCRSGGTSGRCAT